MKSIFKNLGVFISGMMLKELKLVGSFCVLVFLMSAAACKKTESSPVGIVIADSKAYEATIFRQNCAICHGHEANGKEMNGALIPSLRYGEAAKKSEKEIYDQIKFGKLPMPSFQNQLSEEEIQRMVKFIRHDLQGKP